MYLFVLKCFKIDTDNICVPIDIKTEPLVLLPVVTDRISAPVKVMLEDCINYNIFETGKSDDQYQVRRTQFIIADLIKKNSLFSELSIEKKNEEAIRWLWCSAKGSLQGSFKLAQECINQTDLIARGKEELEKIVGKTDRLSGNRNLPRKDRQALRDARNLLDTLTHDQS